MCWGICSDTHVLQHGSLGRRLFQEEGILDARHASLPHPMWDDQRLFHLRPYKIGYEVRRRILRYISLFPSVALSFESS